MRAVCILLLAAWTAEPGVAQDGAGADSPRTPAVETLNNGLRLVVIERPALPLVTAALYLRGGMLLDRAATFRHANLAMGCLWMGHADLDEEAVRTALADIGAEFGSYVDLQDTRVHLSCLAQHARRGLDLLAGALLQPSFADAIVAREREQERRLLLQRSKRPEYLAQEAFVGALVGDHPLANAFRLRDLDGALARIDSAALRATWARMVQPQLGTLLLVGRVTPELVEAARQRFGAWRRPATAAAGPVTAVPPVAAGAHVVKVPLPEMTQVYLQFGTLGPPPDADLAPAAQVLRLAMAGGFSSSLEDELRANRGLVYDVGFSAPSLTFAPPTSLTTQTRPDKVVEVLDVSMRLLRAAAAGGLSPQQIEAAKNMWLCSRALQREPQLGLADAAHRSLRLFGSLDGTRREADAVRSADAASVAAAAGLFDPARLVVVMVGAPEDLDRIDWKPPK